MNNYYFCVSILIIIFFFQSEKENHFALNSDPYQQLHRFLLFHSWFLQPMLSACWLSV